MEIKWPRSDGLVAITEEDLVATGRGRRGWIWVHETDVASRLAERLARVLLHALHRTLGGSEGLVQQFLLLVRGFVLMHTMRRLRSSCSARDGTTSGGTNQVVD